MFGFPSLTPARSYETYVSSSSSSAVFGTVYGSSVPSGTRPERLTTVRPSFAFCGGWMA